MPSITITYFNPLKQIAFIYPLGGLVLPLGQILFNRKDIDI